MPRTRLSVGASVVTERAIPIVHSCIVVSCRPALVAVLICTS
ncbi:MAG: hypothetical protein AB1490_01045 [Pseudomonadota bacterium]